MTAQTPSVFQRILLPGLAFKAVVIGGGYATGREIAEFFLPSGPQGGLMAMALAMVIWSLVCAVTFAFALKMRSLDYRSFFQALLGPFWVVFEGAYAIFLILILSVFAAASGAIGAATFGLHPAVGAWALVIATAAVASRGPDAVEGLFKYVSIFLYAVYGLFLVFALTSFSDEMGKALTTPAPTNGWVKGGLTYAGYNIVGAVMILPVIRHMTRPRDAVVAGVLAGPLAMAPALLFFTCMLAFYPQIGSEALPSDFLLSKFDSPIFRVVFQLMIFSALLESSVGAVHAVNSRLSASPIARGRLSSGPARLAVNLLILCLAVFVAERFGLVTLIAKGYGALAWVFLLLYVAPLLTLGLWRLHRGRAAAAQLAPEASHD